MYELNINEETFTKVNDYYLEVVGDISNEKITKGFELGTYNLFEILFTQLHYRNLNNDFITKEELNEVFSTKEILERINNKYVVKLTPDQYKEIIYLDPKKAGLDKCKKSIKGNKQLDNGTLIPRVEYIDKAIWYSTGKLYAKNEFDKIRLIPYMSRMENNFYFVFEEYVAEKLLEGGKNGIGYNIQYVLDKLKLPTVHAKNLYSYICRNYPIILNGSYFNPVTKTFTNGKYKGEEFNTLKNKLSLTNYKLSGDITRILTGAVETVNEVLNLGLKMEVIKNGIEGKTSTIERIKFTLEPNEKRDKRYLGEYEKQYKPTKKSYSSTRNKSYKEHGVGRRESESNSNEILSEVF